MAKNSLTVFAYDDKEIRSVDNRFSVYDVLVALGICDKPNCQKTLQRIADKHSEVRTLCGHFKFPGRGQRETPVATQEGIDCILRLLNAHPDQSAVTSDKFYPRTETQIVEVLKAAFIDCFPFPQYPCEGYRIDLYLTKPRIAIEIDENGHTDYCSKKERDREKAIQKSLGCKFVRCNPYVHDFNLGDVILEIRGLL